MAQVYLPRQAVQENIAVELVDRLNLFLDVMQIERGEALDVRMDEMIEAGKTYLLKAKEDETIHPSVVLQLTNTLTKVQELLCYSRIKQVM
ncbi:hypothetical protein D3C86_1970370 [compost metagenome]